MKLSRFVADAAKLSFTSPKSEEGDELARLSGAGGVIGLSRADGVD